MAWYVLWYALMRYTNEFDDGDMFIGSQALVVELNGSTKQNTPMMCHGNYTCNLGLLGVAEAAVADILCTIPRPISYDSKERRDWLPSGRTPCRGLLLAPSFIDEP